MRHRRPHSPPHSLDNTSADDHPNRPFGRGHHGRGGRMFEHGRLRWVLLRLIERKPSHGYELIKAIEESTHGTYSPSPGVIYPTLTLLEELGHISVDASDGRKCYSITDTGKTQLQTQPGNPSDPLTDPAQHTSSGIRQRGDLPLPIMRAMENLKMALRLRVRHSVVSPPTATAIAAALDQAAQFIEQLQEPDSK